MSLELGGKSPNIIFPDADLKVAIPGSASGIFFNQGQCCCAGSRLFVHKSIFDEVVDGVAKVAKEFHVGPGFDAATNMGPLVSQEQLDRVCGYLDSGISEGAKAVVGGKKKSGAGYFVEPTVLVDTKPDMKVIKEEIFGPVVAAIPFSDPEEVLPTANNSIYGLAAAVWTRDIGKAHRTAAKLRAGTVWINCYNVFDAALPFRRIQTIRDGAARWATTHWSFIGKQRRSAPSCRLNHFHVGPDASSGPANLDPSSR